jgi:NADH:ubiquinone oxidoreductase subunit 2 (subunit N)
MPIEQFIDYIYLSEVNFDSNLDYKLRLSGVTQLYFFQLIGYYIIVMAIFSSIIGVFDINSGGSAILATINCMSAAKSTIFQAFFCFLVLFFWDSGMLNNFLFKTAFFTLDSYVILICSILCLSVILILMLSSSYVLQTKKDSLEMPTFFSFSLAFMIFFVSSSNLVSAFVSLEGLSFILYVLAALNFTSHASIEAAVKYFCLGGLSSGILLFGITLIYGLMGSTNFFCIRSCLIS